MIDILRELAFELGQEFFLKYIIETPVGMVLEVIITFLLWVLINNNVLCVLMQILNAVAWFFLAYFLYINGHEVLAAGYAIIIPAMIYLFFDAERCDARRKAEEAKKAAARARSRKQSGKSAPTENE